MSRVTSGPAGIGSQRTATSSSDALPQIPQLAVATKWRSGTTEASNGRLSRTMTVSSGCDSAAGSPNSIEATSSSPIRPSVRRKPTASSASEPGVRIVIATATGSCPGPAARISIGSSPTRVSSRSSTCVPRIARIRLRET